MKKILLIFILTTGILSCFCDDVDPFWNVNDFQLEFLNDENAWSTSDTVTLDTINFVIDFDFTYVAENYFQNPFISTAAAASCPNPGMDGMKDPITNITLTCNEDYNTFAAGESLNSIVKHNGIEGFQSFVDQVATFPAVDFISFTVMEKPIDLDSLKFTVQLDFQSGTNISKETGNIFWQ